MLYVSGYIVQSLHLFLISRKSFYVPLVFVRFMECKLHIIGINYRCTYKDVHTQFSINCIATDGSMHSCYCSNFLRFQPKSIYIKKELSRTVVRELLPRATAHGHQTFPDYGHHTRSQSKGGDVREEVPAEECAAESLQTTVRHIGFTEKIYGFPRTFLCCQYKRRTPTVVREILPRTSTKRAQTFPAVAHCTSHQYMVVDVLT